MIWLLAFLLLLGLPFIAYRLLRPRGVKPSPDIMPFPLVLRAAGGLVQYPAFLLLGVLANLPLALMAFVELGVVRVVLLGVVGAWSVLTLPLLLQAAVADGALRPLRRRRVATGWILVRGARGLLRGVPAAFFVTIAAGLPVAFTQRVTQGSYTANLYVTSAILVAAAIVSALYLGPAVAVDRKRPMLATLRESLVVTFGYRLRTLGIVLFFGVIQLLVCAGVLSGLTSTAGRDPSPLVYLAVVYPITTIVGTWHAVTAVIVYHRLRLLRYGGEVDGLLDVFE